MFQQFYVQVISDNSSKSDEIFLISHKVIRVKNDITITLNFVKLHLGSCLNKIILYCIVLTLDRFRRMHFTVSAEIASETSSLLLWQICDFGLSKWKDYSQSQTSSRSKRGTVSHIPPEIWSNINQRRTVKFDVYSFGILFWELITEEQPFKHGNIGTCCQTWA